MPPRTPINKPDACQDEAFQRFLRRVWQNDVAPLLRGRYARQRRTAAGVGGKLAAAGGGLLDRAMRLRGRPFTRAATVLGASLGAMVPDLWDWRWLRRGASADDRKILNEQLARRAAEIELQEALLLLGLEGDATREQARTAWRTASRRWHPDKAAGASQRREHHVRFTILNAAHERIERAFERGELPSGRSDDNAEASPP